MVPSKFADLLSLLNCCHGYVKPTSGLFLNERGGLVTAETYYHLQAQKLSLYTRDDRQLCKEPTSALVFPSKNVNQLYLEIEGQL